MVLYVPYVIIAPTYNTLEAHSWHRERRQLSSETSRVKSTHRTSLIAYQVIKRFQLFKILIPITQLPLLTSIRTLQSKDHSQMQRNGGNRWREAQSTLNPICAVFTGTVTVPLYCGVILLWFFFSSLFYTDWSETYIKPLHKKIWSSWLCRRFIVTVTYRMIYRAWEYHK